MLQGEGENACPLLSKVIRGVKLHELVRNLLEIKGDRRFSCVKRLEVQSRSLTFEFHYQGLQATPINL